MDANPAAPPPSRLTSLDAYRGFVMLAMASGGLGLAQVTSWTPEPTWLDAVAYQLEHVAWRGCTFWDLIQPSFMFIVGVALPFSYAARAERGEPWARQFGHAVWRSLVLVALGIFLSSAWSKQTNFTFVNVLTQIGLGYWLVFLLLGRSVGVQLGVALAILVATWGLFVAYPPPDFAVIDPSEYGITPDTEMMSGFVIHWQKNLNVASDFDRWFLNLFPRPERFRFNDGGYTTLNFVPSISTMIFGVLAGRWLRTAHPPGKKILGMVLTGAACLIVATAMDPVSAVASSFQSESRVICPIVKRLWTPSWVIYSTAWTLWLLAAFYAVIDVAGYRRWAFPLVVVGMNSITMYVMAQLMKPWIGRQIVIHVGTLFGWLRDTFGFPLSDKVFVGTSAPFWESLSVLLVLWLICYWLYRRRIFVRI